MAARDRSGGSDPEIDGDRELLRALFLHVDELVLSCGRDGRVTFASQAAAELLGYEASEVEGQVFMDLVHPDERGAMAGGARRWIGRAGAPRGHVQRLRRSDGTWVRVYFDAVFGPDIARLGDVVLTFRPADDHRPDERDLVQRAISEQRLVRLATVLLYPSVEEFDESLTAALEELSSLEYLARISVWTVEGDYVVQRGRWESFADAPALALPRRAPRRSNEVLAELERGHAVNLSSVATMTADWGWEHDWLVEAGVRSMLAVPMLLDGACIGFVLTEVTLGEVSFGVVHTTTLRSAAAMLAAAFRRHAAEQELATNAYVDPLTRLGNRWAFARAADAEQDRVGRGEAPGVAVVLIDLDRFGLVNEALGHEAGDRVLLAVAERLRSAEADGLDVFRMHGDEFVILVPDAPSAADAKRRVVPTLDSLAPPFDVDGQPLVLSVSAGLAHSADPVVSGIALLQRADLTLQQSRHSYGPRFLVEDESLHASVAAQLSRQAELRAAIDADAIDVHYQGEWNLRTGGLLGAEALARWRHPEHGLLAAGEFIPLAEDCGWMADLGERLLWRACHEAAAWASDLLLRVNVSARQLSPQLVDVVAEVLGASGLPGERLCLELTETALLANPHQAVAILSRLRDLGVGLSIDDFGTGYSSLLQLKRLPFDSVKIDRSFVSGLPDDREDRAIVRAVVLLAGELGLSTTAEGVETDEQRADLLALGCHQAQGFLLSRPEPAASFRRTMGS